MSRAGGYLPEATGRRWFADERAFVAILSEFHDTLRETVLEENPFEHSELALRFGFAAGQVPGMTACTAYYESFRRAVRAMSAAPERAGRKPSKPIEQATDFTLEDAYNWQPPTPAATQRG